MPARSAPRSFTAATRQSRRTLRIGGVPLPSVKVMLLVCACMLFGMPFCLQYLAVANTRSHFRST